LLSSMNSSTHSLTPSLTMTQSTLTPTALLTSLSLTDRQREVLSEFIALRYLESMDMKDLERFFIDTQRDYLKDYTDEELIGEIEDLTETEEFNAMLEVEV
jgi:hypothetical protein